MEDMNTTIANLERTFANNVDKSKANLREKMETWKDYEAFDTRRGRTAYHPEVEKAQHQLARWERRQSAAKDGFLSMTQDDANDTEYMRVYSPVIGVATGEGRVRYEDPIVDPLTIV
jgi:hypothetical protein